ncbi:WAT1-related protein [Melia azedarach]|uniref:WAT1-related protein n=1 Tax=Melia azedarach TaxID=155640 RepID=A0ACC1YUE9_MELAZ|nr:WAT1-related protein [Melia azedarach]
MAIEPCALKGINRLKPHILMILLQICYASIYFISEASFNQGMNPHVYVTYRHIVGALVMFPFAYFLERKGRPKLTLALFMEIFVLSLFGVSLTLNLYFTSLKYTSPTFMTAIINTIPCMTFIIAVILRVEIVDIRSPRGIAKILGTLLSVIGVIVIAFYKGPAVPSLQGDAPVHVGTKSVHENWLKGSLLTVSSCILWSILFIMQAYTLKRYPAKLSLTAWINGIGAAQSAVYTIIAHRKSAAWLTASMIDLFNIIYSGALASGFSSFILLWCTKEKGPVFVTIFNPLTTIFVAVTAYFLVGEKLHTGCILGGIIVIVGLYSLLWGKERDQVVCNKNQQQPFPTCEELKESKDHVLSSTETQIP